MSVLVDSSAWIAYFRGTGDASALDLLIDENLLVTNDLVLAELIPPLRMRRQARLISLMLEIKRCPLAIDWAELIEMQSACLRHGINHVGVPDLIIAQNAIQNGVSLFTRDGHFSLMSRHLPLALYSGGRGAG